MKTLDYTNIKQEREMITSCVLDRAERWSVMLEKSRFCNGTNERDFIIIIKNKIQIQHLHTYFL